MRASTYTRFIGVLSAMAITAACSKVEAPPTQSESAVGRYASLDALPNFAGNWGGPPRRGGPGAAPPGTAPGPAPGTVPGAAPGPAFDIEFDNRDNIPLNEAGAAEVERRKKLAAEGKPFGIVATCLPRGGAAFWAGPGAKEIALIPGKVLIWGALDQDGNNLRRIHTDGRQHSADPDPTYLGESIGTWEGDVLVVDTIGFLPSVSAGLDIPNGGGMHMVERYRLTDPDTLQVEIEIDAPNALTAPHKFTRTLTRRPNAEAGEIVCATATSKVDSSGLQYLDTTPPLDIVLPPGVTLK